MSAKSNFGFVSVVMVAIVVFFSIVFMIGVAFKVILIQQKHNEHLVEELRTKIDTILPKRGDIFDVNNVVLATDYLRYDIRMDLVIIDDALFKNNIKALADSLASMLNSHDSDYWERELTKARKDEKRYFKIADKLSYLDAQRMERFPIFKLDRYKGGFIKEENKKDNRWLTMGKIGSRTIGNQYHYGIEQAYDSILKGKMGEGKFQQIVENYKKRIPYEDEKIPIDGRDIVTTIDIKLQDFAHHALLKRLTDFEADHGCVVVMDVATGAIRAIANLGRGKNGYYEKRNYALGETQELGSTFKPISLMVGLEDGIVEPHTKINIGKGAYKVYGKEIKDSHFLRSTLSLSKALQVSSNVAIVKYVQKYYKSNPQKFVAGVKRLGIGNKIGFNIKGEGEPYVPSPKNRKKWSGLSLPWMAWGYGIELTPMQLLTFYNAIASGGKMVKPHFVATIKGNEHFKDSIVPVQVIKEQIASPANIAKMKTMLTNVVSNEEGTAHNIYSPNFSMAGKTGTAKQLIPVTKDAKGRRQGGYYSNKYYTASFVGFFPAERPKFSCIVVINRPKKAKGYYGSIVAAPVFKRIANMVYTREHSTKIKVDTLDMNDSHLDKQYARFDELSKNYKTRIPDLKGMPLADVLPILENLKLKVKYVGKGTVFKQSPKAYSKVVKNNTIFLTLK